MASHQEDGQLELVVEHNSVHAAGAAQPSRDLRQEVSVEDEEENA